MDLRPNEVNDFLRCWLASGPWVLTSIHPDRKGIETKTFTSLEDVSPWIAKYKDRNLYFHVNPTRTAISKKAEREDIAAMTWLHVDVDPRAGEDLKEEQERALSILQKPPVGVPPPTVIVFSGGGYQGFWKLKEPFQIDGEPTKFEEAARYNKQLELVFGADNCHNVDRIMRLPGSINWPNARKKKKGRTPALAHVVEFHERVYDLADFTPARPTQDAGIGLSSGSVTVSGNIQRLASVDDLPESVNDYCKVVIVQGHDPDDPKKWPSRSEALFYVCCELVRSGVDDDTIYSVITDPDFLISASVVEKKGNADKYALHNISQAHDYAVDPWLDKLNRKHAVIADIGGKCRVISEVMDVAVNRESISRQSFSDFINRYMHIKVVVGQDKSGADIRKQLGKWWLEHSQRRQFESMVFSPEREVPESYNLWRGFSCDSRPGDCSLFLGHIKEQVCGGDEQYYNYLMGWMAQAVQKPGTQAGSAVVLRGRQGTGKSFFVKLFGSLFGRHFIHVSDPSHLVGKFNAHLRDCVVLFGDEAFFAGDKKNESILKMLITEDSILVEAKGVDAEQSANCVHLLMASNEEWVVPASIDDRRFFVLDVGDARQQDTDYFASIFGQWEAGGKEALLHMLLTMDLNGFEIRKIPKTKALREQKTLSFDPMAAWWFHKLQDGKLMDADDGWTGEVFCNTLVHDYVSSVKQFGGYTVRGNTIRLGHFINKACPEGFPLKKQSNETCELPGPDGQTVMVPRPYYYKMPGLLMMREWWDEKFGGPYEWQSIQSNGTGVPF